MKNPRMSSVSHACKMPRPRSKWTHTLYICDCGCGWRATYAFRAMLQDPTWDWEQVL